MNERIQELALQAWVYQIRVYQDNGVRTYGEQEKVFSKEKFAELIVLECAELCEGEAIFAGMNGRKDASASNCATIIRKHFGVEE
jgi:hypothetical protein